MVISVHGENGVVLRNSMPFLWRMTEFGERDKRVWRASTVTCSMAGLVLAILLALMQHRNDNMRTGNVKSEVEKKC
jgi:hypothetical protein